MASPVKQVLEADTGQFEQGMQQAAKSCNQFGKSLQDTSKKSMTFMGEMRAAKRQALELANAYSKLDETARNSDFGRSLKTQLDEALQSAGKLVDLKGDVMTEISNIASDTQIWDGARQGIQVVSSGLQGLASVYGLLGGDVQAFGKALVYVNAIQSVANTLIGVGNALQKQSSLMVTLRTVKNALFTKSQVAANVSTVANTTATVANTAAETANTSATGANTAATVANTAGKTAQTAATTAATGAQVALNTAMMANPIGIVVGAVALLTAGIVAWTAATQKQTDEERGLAEAVTKSKEATTSGYEAYMKTRLEMDRLIKTVNNFNGTKAEEQKLVKELNSKYGESLGKYKSLNDWKAALSTTTLYYCRVLQAEAKYAALNAAAYSAYAKAMGGEDYSANMAQFKKLQEYANDALDDVFFYQKQLEIARRNAGAIIDSGSGKGTKATKSAKATHDEVKRTLNTLEGCNAIIGDAEKAMKKLDRTTRDYQSRVDKLKSTIREAKAAKINFLDKNTVDGLTQARNIMQDIIKELKPGTEEYDKWRQAIQSCDISMVSMYENLAKTGDIESLKQLRSSIEKILPSMDMNSEATREYCRIWREVNKEIKSAEQNIDNLKNGVQAGSIAELEQQKQAIENEIKNLNPEIDYVKIGNLKLDADNLDYQINYLKNKIEDGFEKVGTKPIYIDFSYKMSKGEKIDKEIERLEARLKSLKDMKYNVPIKEWNDMQQEIADTTAQIERMKKAADLNELQEDIQQYSKSVNELGYESFKSFTGSIETLGNVISDLPDRIDDCDNAFEQFFEILNAGFSIVDSIVSFIDNINKLTETITLLTGAKTVMNGVNTSSAAAFGEEATSMSAAATSQAALSSVTGAATPINIAASEAANKLAIAQADLAAANIMAAHSSIPFVGAAIGASNVAVMTAAIVAAHSAFMSLQAFSEGGIVQGSSIHGDKVLGRLNANEMVLNTRQQSHLFDMLNNGIVSHEQASNTTTTFKIKGDDLYVVLKNNMKLTGKKLN